MLFLLYLYLDCTIRIPISDINCHKIKPKTIQLNWKTVFIKGIRGKIAKITEDVNQLYNSKLVYFFFSKEMKNENDIKIVTTENKYLW